MTGLPTNRDFLYLIILNCMAAFEALKGESNDASIPTWASPELICFNLYATPQNILFVQIYEQDVIIPPVPLLAIL